MPSSSVVPTMRSPDEVRTVAEISLKGSGGIASLRICTVQLTCRSDPLAAGPFFDAGVFTAVGCGGTSSRYQLSETILAPGGITCRIACRATPGSGSSKQEPSVADRATTRPTVATTRDTSAEDASTMGSVAAKTFVLSLCLVSDLRGRGGQR